MAAAYVILAPMTDRKILLDKLKNYFTDRLDVVMAFVFGSQSKETTHSSSDWDIAVYFLPPTGSLELENQESHYPQSNLLWDDCIKLLQTTTLISSY